MPTPAANAPSALGAIPPPVTADRKTITNRRVRTTGDVKAAFGTMWTADLERSRQRALCQSAVDGAPPYSDARSRALGQYGRSNFNTGLAARSTFKEQAPYNELLDQMDILTTTPTKWGDEDMRSYVEPIIAEEFTRMLLKWPKFRYLWQYTVSTFVRDGVAITCFDDEKDWQYWVYSMQHFKFLEGSKPCEDDINMCGFKSFADCGDLFRKIQNERIAKKIGWSPKAVKASIKQAQVRATPTDFDAEAYEKRWKANEVLQGAKAPQIETINLLVREVDGSVTHLICDKNADDSSELLYERHNAFTSMRRFMQIYAYGVGTNGDIHSIRGHTSRIFNAVVADTRTVNAFVDMAVFSATPHLECANADAMQQIPMRKVGYMTMIGQGNKFMDTNVPDFAENLIPLHGLMTQLLEGESSGASMMPARPMERKTDRQEQNERLSEGQLTTSAMALFFPALERTLQEVARRAKRRNYRRDEPGGEAVWDMRNRLKARGVDLEALYALDIDAMEVNTGIGKGSQLARMATADALMEDFYLYDDKGKNEVLRIKVATRAGSAIANRIVPPVPGQRPGQQVDNADDQNGFLTGKVRSQILSVKVRPDQNSPAHVRTHLEFLEELWPMTGEQDQRNALETIQPLWAHTIEDLQLVDQNNPLFKEATMLLRQMSEWITNTAKELAAEEDRAADEAARNGMAPPGEGAAGKDVGAEGPNMSNLLRAADAQAKLRFTVAKNEDELRHRREMMALEKAGKIQNMTLRNVETRNKMLLDAEARAEAAKAKPKKKAA